MISMLNNRNPQENETNHTYGFPEWVIIYNIIKDKKVPFIQRRKQATNVEQRTK